MGFWRRRGGENGFLEKKGRWAWVSGEKEARGGGYSGLEGGDGARGDREKSFRVPRVHHRYFWRLFFFNIG